MDQNFKKREEEPNMEFKAFIPPSPTKELAKVIEKFITSFKGDCMNYIQSYEEKQTFSYQVFQTDWKFYSNAILLENLPTYIAYCDTDLYKVLCGLIRIGSVYSRVGALYYLYTMRHRAYLSRDCKIYLKWNQYEELANFVNELVECDEQDVGVAFNHLRLTGAFDILDDESPGTKPAIAFVDAGDFQTAINPDAEAVVIMDPLDWGEFEEGELEE